MPTVADLTKELRQRLPRLPDVNGNIRPEFAQLFDFIQQQDPSVAENYENFFKWINVLVNVQTDPFRNIIRLNLSAQLTGATHDIPFVIGRLVKELLGSRKTEPGYLARLTDFVPTKGRLKVFSLNYDCCLEDACCATGFDVTTGFDPVTKKWNPSLFRLASKGINLYKLHGSLRWFPVRIKGVLVELKPEDRQHLPPDVDVADEAELVLGPGHKIQADDPFLTLFYEFHTAIRQAKTCVVIGYGYGDKHINAVIKRGLEAGLSVIDVNPGGPSGQFQRRGYSYRHVGTSGRPFPTARDVLTNPDILAPYFH